MFPLALFIVILNITRSYEIELIHNYLNFLPDYDFSWITEKESGLRRRFLDRKKNNENQDLRLKLFDKLSNKTLYSDDILHSEISEDNPRFKYLQKYETMFRMFLSMRGINYVYKRDFYWRTWRKINNNNDSIVICYKCQSHLNASRAKYNNNGYWIIEENPPCPFEIYSLITPKTLCVVNYADFYKPFNTCPSKITMEKLLETCDNPIETKWRVIRNYAVIKNNAIQICQGRDSCEVSTIYTINPDSITFRLINSTNHIIYSRIMTSGLKNYACDEDCGYLNPINHVISKNDRHIVVDLLKNNQKSKRDNYKNNKINLNSFVNITHKIPVFKEVLHKPVTKLISAHKKSIKQQKSTCKKIQDFYTDPEETYSEYNDY